jgi:hypothetical protein
MMLIVLFGCNLYYLYGVLPMLINDIVFRVPNDNLYRLVDRISIFKKYDMQIMINDALVLDSLVGEVSANTNYMSSSYDPSAILVKSTDISK